MRDRQIHNESTTTPTDVKMSYSLILLFVVQEFHNK